ncbi:hypothetical protein CCUS01_10270 [Colletotrichum cuscutae]|uniref:Uncharacterized protein n=1 Tax=Colletotrichum cuscutae TaxID=1209917 RepID=A0AAI9UD22_9PEZI|nr:hypothetical protein CCUS01_10270 [Colletotrichum cuscutae]
MKTISSAPRVPLVPPIGPDLTEDPNEGHFELLVDVSEEVDRNVPTGMAVSHAKELRNTQVRIIYNRRKTVVSLASNAPTHTGVPTEDDFDLPVAVSQEVDREALTIMAVSLAKTLRGMNVRVISNRKEVIVSMADKAIKLSDVIFSTLLYYLKKNLIAMVKGARGLDSIISGFEYHNSDRESALKANLLEEFKILNGGPRRPGQKNETVALKVLEKHLAISSDDVRRIIKAAKLSWILALIWRHGSVMSPSAPPPPHPPPPPPPLATPSRSTLFHPSTLAPPLSLARAHASPPPPPPLWTRAGIFTSSPSSLSSSANNLLSVSPGFRLLEFD